MARANPERTLAAILNADSHAEALMVLTNALARTWAAGSKAGWRDGVSDANDDSPTHTDNPYHRKKSQT